MKGVVEVSATENKCPSGLEVNKGDCMAAGLTVGGEQRGGLSFEAYWNDKPSGCFTETFGNKLIFYNTNLNPTENEENQKVSLLCQWTCDTPNSEQDPDTLGCKCIDGYLSQETGQQELIENDKCISSLDSTFIDTTTKRKCMIFKNRHITDMNNLVLTKTASPNDIVIDWTNRLTKSITFDSVGNREYVYEFCDLEPGQRYITDFSYVDASGDTVPMNFPTVTSCSCSPDSDKTGRPKNLIIAQDDGHVTFSFEDDSMCEEAYSFTRKSDDVEKAVSFTRDYFFIPLSECSSVITPLTEASDDLAKSKLRVGEKYTYCVRAVDPILYMYDPTDYEGEGRIRLSSSDTCGDHNIQWEASIQGKITTQPNAGLLPIKDVTVIYELLHEDLSSISGCDGCSGNTTTKQGGAFNIVFKVDHTDFKGKNDIEFPVNITFSKTTMGDDNTEIKHRFLCNDGEDNCSGDIGTTVYLSHLQFREPLHAYDDTSVPFSGKVSIEDTPYEGAPEGCAIANAKVCLIHERQIGITKTNDTLVCGDTDPNGSYSVPVIIGSRVDYVDIKYNGHSFIPAPPKDPKFVPGIVIEGEGYYNDMDFRDTEKARLMVDVAGGLCNETLGESTVMVKIVGCDWPGKTMTPQLGRGIYNNVPAHLLDVQVIDITDTVTKKQIDHIWNFFQVEHNGPLIRTIDLRSTGASDASIEGERESLSSNSTTGIKSKDDMKLVQEKGLSDIEKDEEEDLELVRFQYDGELQMEVSVFPDSLQCSNYSSTGVDSFHVLEYMTYFKVTVDLEYEIIKDKVYCDILDDELKLRVENNVGVDSNEGWQKFYNSISDDQTKAALKKCTDGCMYDIGHEEDEEGNPTSGANVRDWFATGRPNIASPYTKRMIFTIQGGTGDLVHNADFIVEGYYSPGGGRSFALPTHKPIMILRDPPGGLSYATYENVVTTMQLETSSTSRTVYHKFGLDVKAVVDLTGEMCTGGGVGAIALACNKLVETEQKIQVAAFDRTSKIEDSLSDKTRSNEFSTTWSYETSSDPWTAGPMSDVFVVPNLNVMYKEVYIVEWDNATCSVKTEDDTKDPPDNLPFTTTFNIEDTENQPALSFFSRYHVKYVKIPELEEAKANKESQKNDCGCADGTPNKSCPYYEADGTENTITCLEMTSQLEALQRGIDAWSTTLADSETTAKSVTSSKSIVNWFEQVGPNMMGGDNDLAIRDHPSGFASPELLSKAKWESPKAEAEEEERTKFESEQSSIRTDCKSNCEKEYANCNTSRCLEKYGVKCHAECESSYSTAIQQKEAELRQEREKPIKTAHRIQFSGGGNLFSMTMSKEKVWDQVGLSCWDGCFDEHENNIVGPGLDEVTFKVFGAGLETQFLPLEFNIHVLHESTKETSQTESTSIGFVLGDDDPQDEFVVDLFYDDKYGTIIFNTVAGQSKCPHEPSTAAIEDPRLVISKRPSQHVFPEEDMVFELEMTNLGVGDESLFNLYIQNRDNYGSLSVLIDGEQLIDKSREYSNVKKGVTYTKTLVIQRGPLLYEYAPLEISFESTCEDDSSL